MNEHQIKTLLTRTRGIVKQNKELRKARKEDFNIFEVLSVQRYEEHTHSAFIAELLSSDGSHLLGNIFLKHFLKVIDFKGNFNADNYKVEVEKYTGKLTRGTKAENFQDASGGRIDIFIEDNSKNCICIENKIDAGDQEQQLLRYSNYRKNDLELYYLTLSGREATEDSTNNILEAGEHYNTLSYRETILEWLGLCLKEATDHPILRESIKQYIILIKKLTDLMEDDLQSQIDRLILENLETAKTVKNTYEKAIQKHRNKIRLAIKEKLSQEMSNYFAVSLGEGTHRPFSQIWISKKESENKPFKFGIESFGYGGHLNGQLFIGVLDKSFNHPNIKLNGEKAFKNKNWKLSQKFEFNGQSIRLKDDEIFKKTLKSKYFDDLVTAIVEQAINYVEKHKHQVEEMNKNILAKKS